MKKKSKKSQNLKEVKLPMKFNVGLHKFEPILPPPKEKGEEIKFKDTWQWLWLILLMVVLLMGVWFIVKRGFV